MAPTIHRRYAERVSRRGHLERAKAQLRELAVKHGLIPED
jgi:hypothetical protein